MDINIVKLKKYASKCSVLYVEDDEIIRTQTASFLGRFFPDVILAEDGVLGLSEYKKRDFDVVITDINMPNMNGIEMIKAIKEIDYEQIILVTSAYNDSEYLMTFINLDVTRFVLKPFNNKQFLYVLYKIAEELTIKGEKEKLENELLLLSKRAQIIVNQIKIGIIILKDDVVDMANQAFLKMGGFDSFETLTLEMPDIGVLFEEASHCINATTNHELIAQLLTLQEDEKKVRIIKNKKTFEYRVTATKLEEENSYILTFSDITAIHNSLYQDQHTKLPIRKFVLEKIEILKQSTSELNIIIISLKNYQNIAKWYGKNEAISVEVLFSTYIKSIKDATMPNAFIGYFGENKIIVIPNTNEDELLYQGLKEINLSSSELPKKSIEREVDFKLIVKIKKLTLNTDKNLNDLEIDIVNEFDMLL